MNIVPNINAPLYSTSAFVIGLLLCDDLTPAEQNALGGWFMLLGQTLSTNAGQQQLLNNRSGSSSQYSAHIINDDNINQAYNHIKQGLGKIFNE